MGGLKGKTLVSLAFEVGGQEQGVCHCVSASTLTPGLMLCWHHFPFQFCMIIKNTFVLLNQHISVHVQVESLISLSCGDLLATVMWFFLPLSDFLGPIGDHDQTQVIKRSRMALFLCPGC